MRGRAGKSAAPIIAADSRLALSAPGGSQRLPGSQQPTALRDAGTRESMRGSRG